MNLVLFFTYKTTIEDWVETGLFQREIKLYNDLSKKGVNISFVTYDYMDLSNLLNKYGIQHVPICAKKGDNSSHIKIAYCFFKLLINNKETFSSANIIKTNQMKGAWYPIILKIFFRKSLFVRTGYDLFEFSIRNHSSILKKIFFWLITQISIIFSSLYTVTSESDKKLLEKRFLTFNKDIYVRNNWVETTNYQDPEQRADRILLSVGRLEEQKNYKLLIEKLEGSDFKIHIIGDGKQKRFLLNYAEQKNVDLKIFNKVSNDELMEIYLKYRFFILPSSFEGNPKVLLEAMSRGCVSIVSNIDNHIEIIDNNFNGFLVDFKKVELNGYLNELLADEDNLMRISKNSYDFILKNNSLDSYLVNELKDYKLILDN